MPLHVLVIDDERSIRATLPALVQSYGHEARAVATPAEALAAVEARPFDLALLDLKLGLASGLDLIPQLLERAPGLPIILMTAFSSIPTAVEAIRRGARDYLPKPFDPEQIAVLLSEVVRDRALRHRVSDLEQRLRDVPEAAFVTESAAMTAVLETARRVATATAPVLLTGESGTGKSVLARFLHANSPRADGPFIVVNCPTLSEELLASELFGHARGAFTGAVRDAPGRVESASGGTLFLDEIAEMAPAIQARLLRFLQDHQFERVGENRTRTADVRIVAATNRTLDTEVRAGRFREDLLYRLNVIELTLPPLRQRREDIPRLAAHYLDHFARTQKRPNLRFTADVAARLSEHDWPGNLRELRNCVERAVILAPGSVIDGGLLPVGLARGSGASADVPQVGADISLEELEKAHILGVLARHRTAEEAARVLGIDPATLWRKRRRWEGE